MTDALAAAMLLPDVEQVRRAYAAINRRGDVREVRIPKPKRPETSRPRFYRPNAGWFNDTEAVVRAVGNIRGEHAEAVYVTVNPVDPELLARVSNRLSEPSSTTTDENITRLRYLFVDVDASRLAGIPATDGEHAAALTQRDTVRAYLADVHNWPDAYMIGDSGNGGALLYPIRLENSPQNVALLSRVLVGLHVEFGMIDLTTFNPARLMKLPGTVSAKGDGSPTRPWRVSSAVFADRREFVTVEQLQAVAACVPEPAVSSNGHYDGLPRGWTFDDLLRENNLAAKPRQTSYGVSWDLDRCLSSDAHTDGACLIEMTSGAIVYRCQHNTCAGVGWADLRESGRVRIPGTTYNAGPTAGRNGSKPAVLPDPIDFAATQHEYHLILERTEINPTQVPFWLMRLVKHVAPYTPMFPDDWAITMVLPFWATLWPKVHIQNLNLAVWALGINVQGIGKNVATDEFHRIIKAVIGRSTQHPLVLYTGGTPEGIWDRLAGDGRQMLCYHAEFAGFLKLLSRDHMLSAREALCDLYDGRAVGYLRAQKTGVEITDPHVSVAATVTPVAIRNWGSIEDLLNGYLSRFNVVAPNARQINPTNHPGRNDFRRTEIVDALSEHLLQLRDVRRAMWLESNDRDPDLLLRYQEHLGMNTGVEIDLDVSFDDLTMPGGRFIARAKKIATLLELADHKPNVSDDRQTVYIRPEYLDLAIRIVQRGRAYAMRLQSWIAQSGDVEQGQRILRILTRSESGRTQRDLCRLLNASANDVRVALDLLAGAGQAYSRRTGRTERWYAGEHQP